MKESCGKAEVEVERVNGADGKVEVVWKTKDQSALHGKDYIGGEVCKDITGFKLEFLVSVVNEFSEYLYV